MNTARFNGLQFVGCEIEFRKIDAAGGKINSLSHRSGHAIRLFCDLLRHVVREATLGRHVSAAATGDEVERNGRAVEVRDHAVARCDRDHLATLEIADLVGVWQQSDDVRRNHVGAICFTDDDAASVAKSSCNQLVWLLSRCCHNRCRALNQLHCIADCRFQLGAALDLARDEVRDHL